MSQHLRLQKNSNEQIIKLLYVVFSSLQLFILCLSYYDGKWIGAQLCLYMAVAQVAIAVCYGLRNLERRFLIVSFNATYFLFLLSGLWSTALSDGSLTQYLTVTEASVAHTCHCLSISITVVNLFFVLLGSVKQRESKLPRRREPKPLEKGTLQLIFLLFLVVLVAKLGGAIIQYRFLSTNSYVDSYVTSYNKPAYISMPESVFYFCLCLWMATKPNKKQFGILAVIVLVIEAVILVSGDRGEPMATLLLLIYYVYHRSKTDDTFFRITKTRMVAVLAIVPFLIVALQTVKYTRVHETVDEKSNLFVEFFQDQGISATVISKGYVYEDSIREIGGSSYTIGAFRSYLTQNLLARTLFDIEPIHQNTVESATSGNSFGSTLAYLWFRPTYLTGNGCGSSYIAELYHDAGIPFLCIGSALVAVLLLFMSRIKNSVHSLYGEAFILLMFKNIVMLPRGNSMSWLVNTIAVQNLIVLVVLLFVNQMFSLYSTKKGVSA